MNATSLEEGPWNGAKYVLTASAHNNLLCILHAFLSASVFLLGVFFFFFPQKPGILPRQLYSETPVQHADID